MHFRITFIMCYFWVSFDWYIFLLVMACILLLFIAVIFFLDSIMKFTLLDLAIYALCSNILRFIMEYSQAI